MMKDNDLCFKEKELDKGEITNTDFNTQSSEDVESKKRDLARAVDYYRMRIESMDKERIINMERLGNLKIKNDEMHKTDWELRRRVDEIAELRGALADSNIALNVERKKVLKYSNEIENCVNRTKEDRRRIVQLLQLAEPIEQTIKLYCDKPPEKTEKYANFNLEAGGDQYNSYDPNSISIKRSLASTNQTTKKKSKPKSPYYSTYNPPKKSTEPAYRITPSDEKQQILRTVLFPSDPKEIVLNDENKGLKAQIEEIRSKYDHQIAKMEEERKLRDEEFRLQSIQWKEKNAELLKQTQKLEKLNNEVTKDILQLKFYSKIKEKKKYEEMEVMKMKNESIQNTLKDLMNKNQKEKAYYINEYNKKTREITNTLCGQAKTQEENANLIKEQYQQIQKIYNNKVKDLGEKVSMITNKCKLIESKKNLQVEGYINEIILMRKRLRSYENYVMKLRQRTAGGDVQTYNRNEPLGKIEEKEDNFRESNDNFVHQRPEGEDEVDNYAYNTNNMNMYNQQVDNAEMSPDNDEEEQNYDEEEGEEEENNEQNYDQQKQMEYA